MKKSCLKHTALLLLAAFLAISCNNSKNSSGDGIESENPATSQDSASSYKESGATSDTAIKKSVDASRMSDGKDSVKGEVTPPNAREQ